MTAILPHLEQQNVYDGYRSDLRIFDVANEQALNSTIETLYCPSGNGPGTIKEITDDMFR